MKITNQNNLPLPFVRACEREYSYKDKRYSVTSLLKSTRELLLRRRHDNEIEQDCSEMVWALFGSAVHKVLEEYGTGKSEFTEERLEYTLDNGYTVSGIIDFYDIDKAEIVDYKTASVWKVMYNDYSDWNKQGQLYAWLLYKNGLPCKRVVFYAILKDWSGMKAKYDKEYPQTPVIRVEFKVGDLAKTENFVVDKITEIARCESIADDKLPMCSQEERWNDGDKFAVMQKGKKRAVRVFGTREEAEAMLQDGYYIEERKGEDRKCNEYCNSCNYCSYYKELKNECLSKN